MKTRKKKKFLYLILVLILFWVVAKIFFDVRMTLKKGYRGAGFKKVVLLAKDEIYSVATKYNPKGDLLPDWIDDVLKNEAKRSWRFWKESPK